MASVAESNRISQAPPSPLAEFWHYFRENHGQAGHGAVVLAEVMPELGQRRGWRLADLLGLCDARHGAYLACRMRGLIRP